MIDTRVAVEVIDKPYVFDPVAELVAEAVLDPDKVDGAVPDGVDVEEAVTEEVSEEVEEIVLDEVKVFEPEGDIEDVDV